jgi:starch-binding outer membrane protein SusE/F
MKYVNLSAWCILLMMLFILASCDDEKDLNLNVTAVETLYTPEDNLSIQLKPAQSFSHIFEWSQAHAEDGSLVLYEVAFDQENGDFSDPFYTIVSNGKGVDTKLTLTHADLNKVAMLGGADFFEKKKFKWTVLAAKGSNIKPSAQSRVIELERPGGFDVLPGDLYITGSATEGGTDISSALKFKQVEPGKFEIHTQLAPGTYKFVDGLGAGARVFYIKDEGGSKVVGTDGETAYDGPEKEYRIRIDFNSLATESMEIKSVGFWYAVTNSVKYNLDYQGGGIWKTTVSPFNLEAAPWGGFEERHKYRVVLNDGVNDKIEWWGYKSNDSPNQDGKYGNSAPGYFDAVLGPENNQWDWTWKLDRNAIEGKTVDFLMKFPGGDEPYASEYIIH